MNKPTSLRTFFEERLWLSVATVGGLFVAMVVGLVGVGYAGNPVKNLMVIIGGSMLITASLKPRFGLYLLIITSACLDLIKRFVVLFGIGSMGDVAGVLAVAPMILAGIFLGVFVLHPIFTKRMLNQDERRLALFALAPIIMTLAVGLRRGEFGMELLGSITNKIAYIILLPAIYTLYRRSGLEDVTKLLRFLVMVFVPVALYGIHQYLFGLSQFEIDYLRSGLTSTAANLYEAHPRPFSTLNSTHAFCIAMGVMFVLSLSICLNPIKATRGFLSTRGSFLLPPMFLMACVLSLGRAGWVVSGLGFIGLFAFRTKARTILFYTTFLGLFGILVWKADFVFAKLDAIQQMLPGGSEFTDQAFRLSTYSERLFGFQNIFKNRAMWTWFGNPALAYRAGNDVAEGDVVHDALGQILVDYGFVGLFIGIITLIYGLFYTHRRLLSTRNRSAIGIALGFLSAAMAIIFGGMLTGNHFTVFPVNTLFWCMVGALATVTKLEERAAPGTSDAEASDSRTANRAVNPHPRRAATRPARASLPMRRGEGA